MKNHSGFTSADLQFGTRISLTALNPEPSCLQQGTTLLTKLLRRLNRIKYKKFLS